MSDIAKERQEIFDRIWLLYEPIRDILIKAKIPEVRLKSKNAHEFILMSTHINKVRHGEQWLKGFILNYIEPWKKIRAENSEDYWERISYFGGEFTELKRLNELSKKIRVDWFTSHNFLTTKKEKNVNK